MASKGSRPLSNLLTRNITSLIVSLEELRAAMRRIVQTNKNTIRGLATRGGRPAKGLPRKPDFTLPRTSKPASRLPHNNQSTPAPRNDKDADLQGKTPQDHAEAQQQVPQPSKVELVSSALAENESSDLVAPVQIPEDKDGILQPDHPAMAILNHSALVIQRQLEMMNVFLGFEQANKYVIMDGRGETVGYLAEQDHGIGQAVARQAFRTHRSFTSHIFDRNQREVLRIHRPFAWINSRIRIYDPITGAGSHSTSPSTMEQDTKAISALDPSSAPSVSNLPLSEMRIIGETQQQWAPLRRKYNLFTFRPLESAKDDPAVQKLTSGDTPNTTNTALVTTSSAPEAAIEAGMSQFAHINEPFLSWDFSLLTSDSTKIGSVNRSFSGFAREIFTDTGVYALRMDSASLAPSTDSNPNQAEAKTTEQDEQKALTLDQRAVMLASAVSIDFDYFSRHSGAGGGMGFMPLWFPGMGGGAAEAGAAGAGAEAGGAGAIEGAGTAVGNASKGVIGSGEGAMAGAGTMAGYEAMQRGRESYGQDQPAQGGAGDDASPTAGGQDAYGGVQGGATGGENSPGEDVWGNAENDPWTGQDDPTGGVGSGGGGDGGSWFDVSDWF